MMLSIGIVGLPNVGKSTLFNALTKSKQAEAANYPFCTIEPNVGVVEVPDARLAPLATTSKSGKIIPTAIQFVDIAGIVKGASEGEGLGNKFLTHIREADAIVQVVRAFEDGNIIHVAGKVDPKDDSDVINLELALADLATVSKRLDKTKRDAKGAAAKGKELEIAVLEKLNIQLEKGLPTRELEFNDDEKLIVRDLHLLTMKPMMYVVNVEESAVGKVDFKNIFGTTPYVEISAKIEAEIAELTPDDAKMFMDDLGMKETGLDRLIVAGYNLLNLITYFTSGEQETRAWTVTRGTLGPDAAGVIHTDFVKGYIKADVASVTDFVELGGWPGVKEKGKMQLVGKDYEVKDGDVCYFHIT
ncbi:MAG TPA: redox-regulated ATPase YchF [Candidatus Magasanikbacteria bacterium]|nr:redox-regulated ATPase YchF [Candidatus Magasanikbacteria bacterium]